jgi:hypothetical protein
MLMLLVASSATQGAVVIDGDAVRLSQVRLRAVDYIDRPGPAVSVGGEYENARIANSQGRVGEIDARHRRASRRGALHRPRLAVDNTEVWRRAVAEAGRRAAASGERHRKDEDWTVVHVFLGR